MTETERRATVPSTHRIAFFFDFDETLAPTTTDRLVEHLGVDPGEFAEKYRKPLEDDGWEHDFATGYALMELQEKLGRPITVEDFRAVGKDYPLYPGVPEMFGRVRRAAEEASPGIGVEFYLITAGFIEVPDNCPVAGEFDATFGGDLEYREDGGIAFPQRIITHQEKTSYVLAICKGMDVDGPNGPAEVWRKVDHDDWRLLPDQCCFVGDGSSDFPAFRLMRERGGIAIGVHPEDSLEDWENYGLAQEGRRLDNLAKADYSEGGELIESLKLAARCLAAKAALRKLGDGK